MISPSRDKNKKIFELPPPRNVSGAKHGGFPVPYKALLGMGHFPYRKPYPYNVGQRKAHASIQSGLETS